MRRRRLGGSGSRGNLLPQHVAQRFDALALGGERGIGGDLPFECERVGRVELAVDMRVDQQQILVVARRFVCRRHGLSVPIDSIRRRRARASRDITVPIGTSVTCAISR